MSDRSIRFPPISSRHITGCPPTPTASRRFGCPPTPSRLIDCPPTPSRHVIECPPTPSRQLGYPPAPQQSMRSGTSAVTHLSSEPIRVTRDPPLRKVHWPPSEPYGPALDIPELFTVPNNRLQSLKEPPIPVLDDVDGDKRDVFPPLMKKALERPKHNPERNHYAERAARRAQKAAKKLEGIFKTVGNKDELILFFK